MDFLSTGLFVIAALAVGYYLGHKNVGSIGLLQAWNWVRAKLGKS